MDYFVINYLSEPYTLQEDQTTYGEVIKAGGLVVKSECLNFMEKKTNCYWRQHRTNQSVIISTRRIVHPCLEVSVINNAAEIPRIICDKK